MSLPLLLSHDISPRPTIPSPLHNLLHRNYLQILLSLLLELAIPRQKRLQTIKQLALKLVLDTEPIPPLPITILLWSTTVHEPSAAPPKGSIPNVHTDSEFPVFPAVIKRGRLRERRWPIVLGHNYLLRPFLPEGFLGIRQQRILGMQPIIW